MRCVNGDARTSPIAQSRHAASSGGTPKDHASPTANITELAQSCQAIPRGSIISPPFRGWGGSRSLFRPVFERPLHPQNCQKGRGLCGCLGVLCAPANGLMPFGNQRLWPLWCYQHAVSRSAGCPQVKQPASWRLCCSLGRRLCDLSAAMATSRYGAPTQHGVLGTSFRIYALPGSLTSTTYLRRGCQRTAHSKPRNP